MSKKQIIESLASTLSGFGYQVYVSANGEHGFYTDGKRVVTFGVEYGMAHFSGNYSPANGCGTGWRIDHSSAGIDEQQAKQYITAHAPVWANKNPVYTTPEQHLKTYGKSSGYVEFKSSNIICSIEAAHV